MIVALAKTEGATEERVFIVIIRRFERLMVPQSVA